MVCVLSHGLGGSVFLVLAIIVACTSSASAGTSNHSLHDRKAQEWTTNWQTIEPSNEASTISSEAPVLLSVPLSQESVAKTPTKKLGARRRTAKPTRTSRAQRTGPHFVMVVIDDMGFGDLGFKGSGIRTPTMDNLVATGTHLKNYYVLPACTHTRVAIMSGKYPYRCGIYKVIEPSRTFGMKSTDRTMANVLRARGYRAHAVGKWHLGDAWYDYLPTYRGFESFLGIWANGNYFNHSTEGAGRPYAMIWDKQEFCGKNCSQAADYRRVYSTKVFTDRAVRVINTFEPQTDRLFLYLAYQGVHTPYQVPASYKVPYQSKPWSEEKKTYAGMLSAVDEGIGKVIQALKDSGMWKDTVLIVTTDNGASTLEGSNLPLRGAKLEILEGGIRADGIISGPGCAKLGIRKGKNSNLFHAVDWLPTLEDLTRTKPQPRPGIDGVSQKRSLLGGPANRNESFLGYSVNSRDRPKSEMVAAYRQGDMKLIRQDAGEYELYNLASDIGETKNLIGKSAYKQLIRGMKNKIMAYDNVFTKTTEDLGQCPNRKYGKTSWGQNYWIPWCEPDYRTAR